MKQPTIPMSYLRTYSPIFAVLFFAAHGTNALSYILADDNWFLLGNHNAQTRTVYRLGRWGQGFYLSLIDYEIYATFFWTLLLFVSMVFYSWLIANIFKFKNPLSFLGLASVLTTCPVWSEVYILTVNLVAAPIGIGSAIVATYLFSRFLHEKHTNMFYPFARRDFYLCMLLLVLSLSFYQTYLLIFPVIVVSYCIHFLLTRQASVKQVIHHLLSMGACMLIAVFVYFIATKQILLYTGLTPFNTMRYSLETNYVTGSEELYTNIDIWMGYVYRFLFTSQPLVPLFTKILLWVALLLILLSLWSVRDNKHSGGLGRFLTARNLAILLLAVICVSLPWSFGVIRSFDPRSYRYSAVTSSSLLFAIPMAMAIEYSVRKAWHAHLAKTAVIVMVLLFTLNISAANFFLQQNAEREKAIFNRILAQIESHPKYSQINTAKGLNIITYGKVRNINPFKSAGIDEGHLEFLLAHSDHFSMSRCTVGGSVLCRSAVHSLQYGFTTIKIKPLYLVRGNELKKSLTEYFTYKPVPKNQFDVDIFGNMVLVKFN